MCMICDAAEPQDMQQASDFISAAGSANSAMRKAETLLLGFLKTQTGANRKRYSRAHKALVRARRDWNRVEHLRCVEIASDQRAQ